MKQLVKTIIKSGLKKFGLELHRLPKKKEQVQTIEKDSGYYSCPNIENNVFTINGSIFDGEKNITMCCEPIIGIPRMSFEETAMETLEKFIGMRTLLIHEGKHGGGIHFRL